jgi:phosphoribosylformylglycinamidine cyclo-ligase
VPGITQTVGEVLLEPTLVYTPAMLRVLSDLPGVTHSASHITGGGIAQNLQRVLPQGLALTLERGSWSVPPVFPWLAHQGGITLADVEDTWNLGMGLALVCEAGSGADVVASFEQSGHRAWIAGTVTEAHEGQVAEAAKGVSGGFVELRGSWG